MRYEQELWDAVGGLSQPSKMPGFAWGISAKLCNVGSRLRKVEGSTCEGCYALKGHYLFPNVAEAHARRLAIYNENHYKWVSNMIMLMDTNKLKREPYFRWFDSGDLQSDQMMEDIILVATATPWMNYWLPTRETAIVERAIPKDWKNTSLTRNLTVRLSLPMVDMKRPAGMTGRVSSGVSTIAKDVTCPAPKQGNECRDCRKCWTPTVKHVVYARH